jgi:DNA-binding Lrp family transcriptional regulator
LAQSGVCGRYLYLVHVHWCVCGAVWKVAKKRKCVWGVFLTMRKNLVKKLLIELLRDSKQSDRMLAKKLGVSQPTITRTRSKLERAGYIKHYTFIPDLRKIGLNILAFTFVKMNPSVLTQEMIEKVRKYAAAFPNGIFAATGEGMGMTGVIIGVHKDYRDYARKLASFRSDWGKYLVDIQSFVMTTEEGIIKDFSFKYIDESVME